MYSLKQFILNIWNIFDNPQFQKGQFRLDRTWRSVSSRISRGLASRQEAGTLLCRGRETINQSIYQLINLGSVIIKFRSPVWIVL